MSIQSTQTQFLGSFQRVFKPRRFRGNQFRQLQEKLRMSTIQPTEIMKPSAAQLNVSTAAEEMGLPASKVLRLLIDLDCQPDAQGNFTALDLLCGAYRICPDEEESRKIVVGQLEALTAKYFAPSR